MPHPTFQVTCYNCRSPFDAFEASRCSCLVNRQTFVCPTCLVCFCKASDEYRVAFWANAPRELVERSADAASLSSSAMRSEELPRLREVLERFLGS